MVNHATKCETAKVTVTPYMAGMVNHATNDETAKVTDTIYLEHDTVMEREERLRREQYCARRNRETAEETELRLEAKTAHKRCQNAMMLTSAATNIVAVEKAS